MKLEFTQISAGHSVYALDKDGRVWVYAYDTRTKVVQHGEGLSAVFVNECLERRSGWEPLSDEQLVPFAKEERA